MIRVTAAACGATGRSAARCKPRMRHQKSGQVAVRAVFVSEALPSILLALHFHKILLIIVLPCPVEA